MTLGYLNINEHESLHVLELHINANCNKQVTAYQIGPILKHRTIGNRQPVTLFTQASLTLYGESPLSDIRVESI